MPSKERANTDGFPPLEELKEERGKEDEPHVTLHCFWLGWNLVFVFIIFSEILFHFLIH